MSWTGKIRTAALCAAALNAGGAGARSAPTGAVGATPTAELAARRAELLRSAGRPTAALPLYGVLDLWDWLDDRAPLVAFLDEAAHAQAVRPDVRGRAGYLHSLLLDRLGRAKDARAERAALGLVTRFWIVGPFENEGRTGHATVYGPERALAGGLDPGVSFDGKDRSVRWRRAPELDHQGQVRLDAFLRPDSFVTGYLTTFVRVDPARSTRVALRVGSSGPVKVWVNGRLALDHDVARPVRFDQDAAPAELQSGWNRVTVKLGVEEGAWALFLRLTAPDGRPLASLESTLDPPAFSALARGATVGFKGSVADVGRELEQAAKAGDPPALTALAEHLLEVVPEDPEQHRAASLLERAVRGRPTALGYRLLARAEADPNDRRHALERALETGVRAPAFAAPLSAADRAALTTELGSMYHQVRRDRRAEALWRAALELDPSALSARLELCELTAERGLIGVAAGELEALAKAHPALKILRARAELALRRGRWTEAESAYKGIVAAQADDEESLRELFARARARGGGKEALEILSRIESLGHATQVATVAFDRAELYDSQGRSEEAVAALKSALGNAPEDPRILERLGKLYHRLGREKEALDHFTEALELRPQNPELRAYVQRLSPPARGGDLPKAYSVDVSGLIATAPPVQKGSADPARVLYDGSVTRVHRNGLSETFVQRVVQILDERGVREVGDFDVRYTPDTQSIEVRAARVHKPNGDVVEATTTGERDLSEPWYGLYYDVKAQVIQFSALEPGDVIDVEYTLSDVARRNQLSDYFGDVHYLQEELPRLESRYLIIAPKERKLYFNKPRLLGLERDEHDEGDERVYRFVARATPKIRTEPGMPGYSELAAYVHVSTYKTWREVSTWYTGLVRDQLQPSEAIKQAVHQAVDKIPDELSRIRALYDLVVRRTRYVGLEFGIHGYQPYRVSQVFARKFGDCKDKASLLTVMLREIGVDASLVLARTRRGGDLDPEPASLAPFDHAIVYVPKYRLYLDGTAEFSGASELPAQDQDIPVLVVSAGRLERTPVLPPSANRVSTTWQVALEPTGEALVDERVTISGEAAHEWRAHYQALGERHERYEKAVSAKHPGTAVRALEMPTIGELEQPIAVHAQLAVPRLARPTVGDGNDVTLSMPVLGHEADMQRSYARLSERQHDLVLGYPWQQDEHLTITLPAGFTPRRVPEPRTIEGPFGRFQLTTRVLPGAVEVSARLEVTRHRIARADYSAFRRFCGEVDAAVGEPLVLEQRKAAAAR
jgi:tetratricopeptide (TPR) repeat protein